ISLNEKIICLDNQKELVVKNIQNHESNFAEISAFNRVALSLNFRVGDDKECLKLVFIDRADFILMGISSNEASKNAIINAAN
ncbi:hypothetical protein VWM68_11470, partial [Campylobacter coli]